MGRPEPSVPRPPRPLTRREQRWLAAGVAVAAAALGWLAMAFGWLHPLERIAWDSRSRLLAVPAPATSPVRLVLVDEASLRWAEERLGVRWPWPRELHAAVVDFCARAGVRSLTFDLLLSEGDLYPEGDARLAASIREAAALEDTMPVVLALFPGEETGARERWPASIPSPRLRLDDPAPDLARRHRVATAAFPVPELAAAATALGHVRGTPDDDGVVRRLAPIQIFDGHPIPALGLAAALAVEEGAGERRAIRLAPREVELGGRRIPVDGDGRAVLRFRRPLEAYGGHLYPAFSAAAVIHSELRLRDGLEPELDPAELRGSHVLYAAGAAGLHDLRATPVSPLATGAEIHATALDNFLEDAFYRPAPGWVTAALVLLAALLGAFSTLLARSAGRIAVAFGAVLAVPPLAGTVAALLGGWWRIAEPAAAALLALVGGTLARHATEGRRRRFVERAFERYLSPAVIRRLIDDPTRLELGGERRELTIFFSDLAGFSTFAEKLDPRELTALLNDYLSEMTELILDQDGTLDKYEGDAILAFWNAPLDQPDHALRACRAALAGSRRLAELRPRYRRRLGLELRMRVGIHTGPVVVGNMGSRRRFDYTVLGDAANLASRLEGANKAFGTELMVSEACWRRTGGAFQGREIGEVVVVGRQSPVRVFEPLGVAGEPEPPWLADWRQALDDCRNGRYHRALAAFDARAGAGGPRIGDPLAERYAERLRRAIEAGETWDGVWRLESK